MLKLTIQSQAKWIIRCFYTGDTTRQGSNCHKLILWWDLFK